MVVMNSTESLYSTCTCYGIFAEEGLTQALLNCDADRYREPAPGMSVFNFEKADEDEAFELVDNKPVKKTYGQTQRRPQNQGRWGQQQGQGARQDGRGPQKQRQQGGFRQQQWKDQARERTYSSSIVIQPDWHVLGDQIALSALQKLSSKSGEPEELVALGSLALYDRAADRVGPKTPAKLQPPKVRARAASTWEDPVMQKLAAANEGDVFMTDAILSVIMTAPRSVHSWDIVVIKKGSQIFFDRRSGSSLEYVTNGETAPDPPQEDRDNINGVESLNHEATSVNQAFRESVLANSTDDKAHKIGEDLPTELRNSGIPPPGYTYKRWTLGGTRVVVRCETDCYLKVGNTVQSVAVHALNEFDPKWSGIDWRTKLDTQRGAVLATELKNNATKMARWTAAALVSGVDVIKIGYVTRSSFRDTKAHQLLGTQAVKPKDFASQMNLNMDNAWGIARALISLCIDKMDKEGMVIAIVIS